MKFLDLADVLDIPQLPIYLDQIQNRLTQTANSANPTIQKSINRLISTKSKRLRPALLIAVVVSQNEPINDKVFTGCAAIELVHIGSLVHDDIIDDAKTRWNVETVNSREGINHAILVGDFLFAKACELGASQGSEIGQLVASTIASLINGESLEMADQYNTNRSLSSLEKVIQGKSASLISSSCQVGGLCAGLNSQQLKMLAKYGEAFGMSFQLIDDLLDLLSSIELSGKPSGNDIREGIYTMPLLLSLAGINSKNIEAIVTEHNDDFHSVLVNSLINDGSIEKTIIRANKYNQIANKSIRNLGDNDVISGLSNLPDIYLKWCLEHLIDEKYRLAISKIIT